MEIIDSENCKAISCFILVYTENYFNIMMLMTISSPPCSCINAIITVCTTHNGRFSRK